MGIEFPQIYLLNTNYEGKLPELQALEKEIDVVFNIYEAEIVLGNLTSKFRVPHELRKIGLWTEEVQDDNVDITKKKEGDPDPCFLAGERQRVLKDAKGDHFVDLVSGKESKTEFDDNVIKSRQNNNGENLTKLGGLAGKNDTIRVLNLAWYTDSMKAGILLPQKDYFLYEGRILEKPKRDLSVLSSQPTPSTAYAIHGNTSKDRTIALPPETLPKPAAVHGSISDPSPNPLYLLQRLYACQRPTLLHPPNEAFIAQLRMIKEKKEYFEDDANGHAYASLAYSRCIASLVAYPYLLTGPAELAQVPHCGPKIVALFKEWRATGKIREVEELATDERFQALRIFYSIFDVGAATAWKFYDQGWRNLDDVVKNGWGDVLTRTQQIGIQFYDDFQARIPRAEVERIADHILDHACRIKPGFEMVICGSYRKGKPTCGDVDVVLSHREKGSTFNFLSVLLKKLVEEGSIFTVLRWGCVNSQRQNTVVTEGFGRASGQASGRGPFDRTLDHALVVWQHQSLDTSANSSLTPGRNIKRRVDIIVSPWETAGCAILGWSSGIMFGRDLRLYCHKELGYEFNPSGIRREIDGKWMDLEAGDGDMLIKEQRLFDALKLEWRDPTERCTD